MNTNGSLVEKQRLLSINFEKFYGVSLRDCAENPELMSLLSRKRVRQENPEQCSRVSDEYGRGYPFMGEQRISAADADAENLEILAKW